MTTKLLLSSIPHKYLKVYLGTVEDYYFVYNPVSESGITVLNKESYYVYSLINEERSVKEIYFKAKEIDPNVTQALIKNILKDLIDKEVIYIGSPKNHYDIFKRKPTQLGVWLHLTNQCNLRCTYCYVWKSSEYMSANTSDQAIKKIIQDGKKEGFKKIKIKFSGGECLLKLDELMRLVKLGKSLSKKSKVEIGFVVLTNGVLLTPRIAKIFKEEGIEVAVSMDGLGKYNDSQRVFPNGLGSFKFVERGINELIKYKIPFNVSVTITKNNIEHIPELTQYFLKNKIRFAFNFFRENFMVKEELISSDNKLITSLKKAYKYIYDNPPQNNCIDGLLDRVSFRRPHNNVCGMGKNYIVVRNDGKLVSCQMTLDKPIGSITDKNIIETMKEGTFLDPKTLTVDTKPICKDCQWKYLCGGGCPLLNYKQTGSFTSQSPYCNVYRQLIPEVLKLEAKRIIRYGFELKHA